MRAGGAGENAFARGLVFKGGIGWDAADCDLQVFFDLSLDSGVTAPMGKGKAAVDLRALSVLWGEEIIEVGL